MRFEKGDRVICVNPLGDLVKGRAYTVAGMDVDLVLIYETGQLYYPHRFIPMEGELSPFQRWENKLNKVLDNQTKAC